MTEQNLLESEEIQEKKYLLTNCLPEKKTNEEICLLKTEDTDAKEEKTEEDKSETSKNPQKSSRRRADIDVIIIFLTYGIHLFHLSVVYFPANRIPHSNKYPNITSLRTVSEDPFTIISPSYFLEWFAGFMYAWNMPMFFHLSGHNAYAALFRRSETEFRDERVHRLLVPCLFFVLVGQLPYSISYFSPTYPPRTISYWEYIRDFYRNFDLQAAWFLFYLFMFYQIMTYWFTVFHPAHNSSKTIEMSCCGSRSCCCSVKPFNCLTRFFCCLNFLCRPATTPEAFVLSVTWFLGGPFKLALVPGILLGLFEVAHNLTPFFSIVRYRFLAAFFQFTTTFSYLMIFVLGYATAAADNFIKQDSILWSWACFIFGMVLCSLFGVVSVLDTNPLQYETGMGVIAGFCRGIGQWLFIIGLIAIARRNFTESKYWHPKLREMALPFYLVHQWVNNPVVAGLLWVPYLRSFPVVLVITSVLALGLAYLITKSGSLRYFFGLPPPKGSCLPGQKLRGFIPVIILVLIEVLVLVLANSL
jgi:hypothetical protein